MKAAWHGSDRRIGCSAERSIKDSEAFTLLELLVVIAIIALLAALLLPALSGAKAKAHKVECMSRLKQWHLAFTMYVEDYEGWIPRECYDPHGEVTADSWSLVKGKATESRDVWYNALPPYLGQPPSLVYSWPPPKRKEFYDPGNLIHCPGARFPRDAYNPNCWTPFFSIAMNSQLIERDTGPTVKFNQITTKDSVRIVIFLDNLLEGETKVDPDQASDNLGQPGSWANRFGARHQKGGNLAFADGHVQWFPGTQVVETGQDSFLKGGPILPPRDIVWEVYPF